MTAALHAPRPVAGFDRLVLTTGLALVAWSRRRSRARIASARSRAGSRSRFGSRSRSVVTWDPEAFRRERELEALLTREGVSHTLFR